ncbi:MAG: glycosyltransferase [Thermoplasmata archaeon]
MQSLLIVTDPIADGYSVQFEFIKSITSILRNTYNVSVFSPYLTEKKAETLEKSGIGAIVPEKKFHMNNLLKRIGRSNESMLWVESWFREAYLGRNSIPPDFSAEFDRKVNLSTTVPVKADVWWIQGRSFYYTLLDISKSSGLIKYGLKLLGRSIKKHDLTLLERLKNESGTIITNAKYLKEFYENLGFNIEDVVYTAKDFSAFRPVSEKRENYVLTYIGKETDIDAIIKLADAGIRIKGFGSKVPVGISLNELKNRIEYLGYVSHDELLNLYSEALFTAFPFIEEPFGYVPIESMACGTPVLSYNKQGPGETIINGKTGWLVSSVREFVELGRKIWNDGHKISREDCIERAKEFSTEKSVEKLLALLKD